jgi:P-type Cu+ transporter
MTNQVEYYIDNMHCSSCIQKIEDALKPLEGVEGVEVDLLGSNVFVTGGINDEIITKLKSIGHTVQPKSSGKSEHIALLIESMSCASCIAKIEKALSGIQGLQSVDVNLLDKTVRVEGSAQLSEILFALKEIGYPGIILDEDVSTENVAEKNEIEIKKSYQRAAVAAIVGFGLMALDMLSIKWSILPNIATGDRGLIGVSPHLFWVVMLLVALATMVYSGKHYYVGAWQQLKHFSSNMDTLVALGTGAAWIYSAIVIIFAALLPHSMLNIFLDTSVLILAFLNFGNALEAKAKGKTSQAIQKLIGLQPNSAVVIKNDVEIEVPVAHLSLGDIVRIYPGNKIPVDGVVISGHSRVNESMLTGEPLAVSKKEEGEVFAGTLNENGSLDVCVSTANDETALAKIVKLVRSAQASKPAIGRLVDKITAVFVPIVVLIAIVTFIVWSFFSIPHAVTAAIAVLVIACPCALGLGTPIAMMIGTGKSAEYGILIRNGEALQSASELTYIVFDKTGTITEGAPSVTNSFYAEDDNVEANSYTNAHINAYVNAIESRSEHPLAQALSDFTNNDAKGYEVKNFNAVSARGVLAVVAGKKIILGNTKLMIENAVDLSQEALKMVEHYANEGATPVLVAIEGKFMALFAVKDPIKESSKSAIKDLQALGIKTAMISGDNELTANAIARQVGISTVYAEVMPEDKSAYIEKLQGQGERVGMVGDGINDAPALTQANVGFAIGSGTDVAIESADVTLASSSLNSIHKAIHLSKATMRNIKQSLFGAFIYNTLGIFVAAGIFYPLWGILLSPIVASAAMAASSVTVVLVASRLRKLKL